MGLLINSYDEKSIKPKIAVLLAAFNGCRWIEEQIDSICAQQGVSLEIFISVDISTDGTLIICQNLAAVHSCIHVISFDERFGGAAPNFFKMLNTVDFSTFDYISLADQDDIWLPDKLIRAHDVISRTGADAYSSNVMAFWPDGRKALVEKSQAQVRWDFLFEAAGPGCTYVFKRQLACAIQEALKKHWTDVRQVGLHDWFLYAFARANGFKWVIDSHPTMLYRQHQSNQVGVNIGWRAAVYRAKNIFGGWGLSQSALITRLVGLEGEPFVRRWLTGSRLGFLWLALHSRQCRRRKRDQMLFFLSCMVLFFYRGLRA